ncbi:MAG: hypothetical protein JNL97_11800 [Verrucomicrobiales bacterium]|nr:hypothetical protein [Verrucomicrobiales bacterium]
MNSPRLSLVFPTTLSPTEKEDWQKEIATTFPEEFTAQWVEPRTDASRTRGEIQEWVTLILSIPPAVLAVWDLAARMKLKPRIERWITLAKERRARGQQNPFLALPDQSQVPLDEARPEQVLDAVSEEIRRRREEAR